MAPVVYIIVTKLNEKFLLDQWFPSLAALCDHLGSNSERGRERRERQRREEERGRGKGRNGKEESRRSCTR